MVDSPLISVICPVYNIEKYLAETLETLKSQIFENVEFILVNDGSTDSSPDICESFAKDDPRFKIFNTKNQGPGAARNFGIEQALGKYITLMDHDDLADKEWLKVLYDEIVKYDADIALCKASEYYDGTGKTELIAQYGFPEAGYHKIDEKLRNEISRKYFPPWMKLVKRELILKHQIKFAENFNRFDDVLFHLCLIHHANDFVFADAELYRHRVFEESITEQSFYNGDMYFDHLKTIEDIADYANSQDIKPNVIINRIIAFFRGYKNIVQSKELYIKEIEALCKKYKVKKEPFSLKRIRRWFIWIRLNKKQRIVRLFGVYILKKDL